MNLKKVDIKKFKKVIFKEYKKLFPSSERKLYIDLKRSYDKGMTDIIEIIEEEQLVGFIIINFLEGNPYAQLDYFAILSEHQHKGYGTKAIKLLKEMYQNYDGICIEIEKVGNGNTDEENRLRERRAKFYENLGFKQMDFDLILYKVLYSAHILPCATDKFEKDKVIENIWEIYSAALGKRAITKNCRVIKH